MNGMIVIFSGISSKHLTTEVTYEKCPECKASKESDVLVFQRYAQLMFMPFFPWGKEAVLRCRTCQRRTREYGMSPELLVRMNEIKRKPRTPFWMYMGFPVLALIIAAGMFGGKVQYDTISSEVASPKPGDVYDVDEDNGYHTAYRVQKVHGDTVFVLMHTHQVKDSKNVIGDLLSMGEFMETPVPVLKKELIRMCKEAKINAVGFDPSINKIIKLR
jgi:hypothetical protein